MSHLMQLRKEYGSSQLDEAKVNADPVEQFKQWLHEALEAELHEPYAMTLATVSPEGVPSARIVLLRQVDEKGFVFFTNYRSSKGSHLASNPKAALLFYWAEVERQVRIEGSVGFTSEAVSETYFHQRPRGSQIAACVSEQSEVVANRKVLEERFQECSARYAEQEVPRPKHWGGYVLRPEMMEFWQGRANRLHDRLRYQRTKDAWVIERLSP